MVQEKSKKILVITGDNAKLVEQQLAKILASPHFKSAGRMQDFLKYIVQKTLQGEASQIKQYTIAVEALKFADDFDSDINPAVRIMAGRVRGRLDKYYNNEGINDGLIINMPKGSYAPEFEEKEQGSMAHSLSSNKSRWWLYAILALLFITIATVKFNQRTVDNTLNSEKNKQTIKTPSNQLATNGFPFVDVMHFEDFTNDSRGQILSKGIRYQLITELSQFDMIRVRNVSNTKGGRQKHTHDGIDKHTDYRIDGVILTTGENLQMTIILSDSNQNEVVWAGDVTVPATDEGFDKLIYDGVKGVMSKLTNPSGIMQIDAMKRIHNRLQAHDHKAASSYECIVVFYNYDLTKDVIEENAARKCLKEFTDKNIRSSTLWAAYSFMHYVDWTRRKDHDDDMHFQHALVAVKKAINIDPFNAQAHEFYGTILMAKNQSKEALAEFSRALELNPSKPDIHVLIGWNKIQDGDWDNGIEEIRKGIAMSYLPPGWFRIPLAVDAFRRNDFEESLKQAEEIYTSGDKRGIILSLAAAIKLNKSDLIERYAKEFLKYQKGNVANPLSEIAHNLRSPEILKIYTETVKPALDLSILHQN